VYVYVYIYIYTYTYTHTHICVEIVYELLLLSNNTAVKHIYPNWEQCKVLTGYLSLECRPCNAWVNMWHWTRHFTIVFSNTKY